MRTLAFAFFAAAVTVSLALPAVADMTFTVTKDSTMDGNAGQLMRVSEPGFPSETYFIFVGQDDMVRVYAVRSDLDGTWTTPLTPVYLVPATTISAGQTWAFLPMGGAFQTVAEAITMEMVTTNAGSFISWRVDVTALGAPDTVLTTFWFASDVGWVKQVEYEAGKVVWRTELQTYDVSGSGYLPLVIGNTWSYVGLEVPNQATSIGKIKGSYAH
jgi:hypothetical protein